MTKNYIKNGLQAVLRLYLLFLCVIFPLYIANGKYDLLVYYKKDLLYRTSAVFAIVTAVLVITVLITDYKNYKNLFHFTHFDLLMGISFVSVCISYLNSMDHYQALNGAPGWFMGLKTYLILLFIYVIYAFFFCWNKWDTVIIFSGPFIVLLLAVLNRFGLWFLNTENIDPMYLSTIGNINWMNAYTAIVLPAGAGMYVTGIRKNKLSNALWCIYLVIGWLSVLTNGSDAVYLWLMAMAVLLICYGFSSKEAMHRVLNCFILFGVSACFLVIIQKIRPDIRADYLFPNATSISGRITRSWKWFAFIFLFIVLKYIAGLKTPFALNVKKWIRLLILCEAIGVIILLVIQIIGFPVIPDNFGTGRGYIWRLSREHLYPTLSAAQKLFGLGPDCFGKYSLNNWDFMMGLMEMFPGSHTTNAHSEPLTMLYNLGWFGTISYLSVLIYGMLKVSKSNSPYYFPVLLAIISYTVNQLVSFQLIISTPYFYLSLACTGKLIRLNQYSS